MKFISRTAAEHHRAADAYHSTIACEVAYHRLVSNIERAAVALHVRARAARYRVSVADADALARASLAAANAALLELVEQHAHSTFSDIRAPDCARELRGEA